MLVREKGRRLQLSIGIDGVIVALAIAALCLRADLQRAAGRGLRRRAHLVGGELAYPILDLATLTMLAVICIPSRFRVGPAYFWLMAGMAVLLATDVANLKQTTNGADAPSVALYFGWGLAIVLLALSSRFSASLTRTEAFRGPVVGVALGGAILLSLCLLLQEAANDQNPVVLASSGAVVLLGLGAAVPHPGRERPPAPGTQ